MRSTLAQFRSTIDPWENLVLVTNTVSCAARGGTNVVIFPEAAMCSFLRASIQAAKAFDGPWTSAVRCLVGNLGITTIAGIFTEAPGVRVHSTLLVTDESEGHYDKIHLFDVLGQHEPETVAPGLRSTSIEVIGYGSGLIICYDVRFPTHSIDLTLGGATIMVVCASWVSGSGELHQWRTLTTTRAMDPASFVAAVDWALQGDTEASGNPAGVDHSTAVDPTGWVLLELGAEPDLAFADVGLERVTVIRETLPVLDGNRFRSL